jgi:hypothetical protein
VQHERHALRGGERVEHDQQREADRVGQQRLVLGIRPGGRAGGRLALVGIERHLGP